MQKPLRFSSPKKSKSKNDSLDSSIEYKTPDKGSYDGDKLNGYVTDEMGQMLPMNRLVLDEVGKTEQAVKGVGEVFNTSRTKKRITQLETIGFGAPVAPADKFYIRMKKAIEGRGGDRRDQLESGLHVATDFNPGEHVEVTGIIASIPRRGGIPGLRVGDEIAFSYLITYNEQVIDADNDEVFYEDEQLVPHIRSWSNNLGVTLEWEYKLNDKWQGRKIYNGVVDDVVNGTHGQIESWIERNKFRERAGKVDVNKLSWEGREYWAVHSDMVYAVKRGERVEAVPGYLLCALPEKKEVIQKVGGLFVANVDEKMEPAWIKVLVSANSSEYLAGKEVYVKMNSVPMYNFWGVDYILVREDQVLASRDESSFVKEK